MSNKFADYVAEVEATGTVEDAERLNAYREHFSIARQLIELRKAQGMSQGDLAQASGVHQSEISRIERGASNPTEATLNKLGGPLGRSIGFVEPATR